MREIVTLQFGNQANYVGTHYWNTQESYFTYAGQEQSPVDHDVSFRAGVGADGSDTYTPRTLIYDLKGGFGTLRRENALYRLDQQENQTALSGGWSGPTVPLQLPPIAPSGYQQALDEGLAPPRLTTDSVRFWSDYNHIFYHPRSIVQLHEYELNSTLMPFERWQNGEELFTNLDREYDLLDRDLRPFLEECDQLQGIQILTGIDDAWGGFASRYLERIADDMGKGSRWVFGLQDGKRFTRERQMLQVSNSAQSLYSMNLSASMQIPLSSVPAALPSYIALDAYSAWHTAALQAALFESITLPTRLRRQGTAHATFDHLETDLSNEGNRRIAAAELSLEDPANLAGETVINGHHDSRMANGYHDKDTNDYTKTKHQLDVDFLPSFTSTINGRASDRRTHVFTRIESLRGPWKAPDEILEMNVSARDRFRDGPRATAFQSPLLFPLLPSSPGIVHLQGSPESLAVKTSLSTSTVVADRIRGLEGVARRMIGIDEREALCDGLVAMAEEYEDGWSDGEDGGDDD